MLRSTSAPRGRCESAPAWLWLGATAWQRQRQRRPGSAAAAAAAEGTAACQPQLRACVPSAAEAKGPELHVRSIGEEGWEAWEACVVCAPSRALSHPSTPPHRLNDSTRYFFERAADILSSNYQPTEQDSLRARVRTTGIVQQHFEIKERKYTMFDVGGQRNERRKWIHCFDNVTACIFVTAISEFDQKLYEV